MKIVTLLENGKLDMPGLRAEHGVSLYIETKGHKMLLDVGPGKEFLDNAKALGVDISEIDSVVISHGHFDHGGGLKYFLENNNKARIFIKDNAFERHYAGVWKFKFNCGLDSGIMNKHSDRFVLVNEDYDIDIGIRIVADIGHAHKIPKTNGNLFVKHDGKIDNDDFNHEIVLLIEEDLNLIAISGCGHTGVKNIVDTVSVYRKPDQAVYLISGFHLKNPRNSKEGENPEEVESIAAYIREKGIERVYTGHCTGDEAYQILKKDLGDKLDRFITGKTITIG